MDRMWFCGYTGIMKRIQLKEFSFLIYPDHYKQDWQSLRLTTAKQAELPNAPLLLAVSGEPFLFETTLSIPPSGWVGVCAYHIDSVFASVGVNEKEIRVFTTIRGYPSTITYPFSSEQSKITWLLKWDRNEVKIGYRKIGESDSIWVGTFDLPGTANSISYGPFFASGGEAYEATAEDFHMSQLD